MLSSVWLGTLGYREAWTLQSHLAAARATDDIDDCVILLEHPPVYTMGRNGNSTHLGEGVAKLMKRGADYVDVDRGGSVTFHGPGQLVAYPIIKLAATFPIPSDPRRGDVDRYLRALESALIATAARWDVRGVRRPPHTGVWIEPDDGHRRWRKLAAIGVKLAAGGVTMHGIALNVTTDLSWFDHVVPCGISDAGVVSLREQAGDVPALPDVAQCFSADLVDALGATAGAPDDRLLGRLPRITSVPVGVKPD